MFIFDIILIKNWFQDFDHCRLWKNLGSAVVHTMSCPFLVLLLWKFFMATLIVGVELCWLLLKYFYICFYLICANILTGKGSAYLPLYLNHNHSMSCIMYYFTNIGHSFTLFYYMSFLFYYMSFSGYRVHGLVFDTG